MSTLGIFVILRGSTSTEMLGLVPCIMEDVSKMKEKELNRVKNKWKWEAFQNVCCSPSSNFNSFGENPFPETQMLTPARISSMALKLCWAL